MSGSQMILTRVLMTSPLSESIVAGTCSFPPDPPHVLQTPGDAFEVLTGPAASGVAQKCAPWGKGKITAEFRYAMWVRSRSSPYTGT
jgi:hypothetical protein